MPKVDITKKRNDPDAEVKLQSFWERGGVHNYQGNSLVPFSWGEDWGRMAHRFHNQKRDMLIPLGQNKNGRYITLNLSAGLSLLVAGSALSGIGVFRRIALLSLLKEHTPETLQLVIIDPIDALKDFSDVPHLATPRAVSVEECRQALEWCKVEQERRSNSLSKDTGLLYQYNLSQDKNSEKFPSVVIVITEIGELTDEYGDFIKILSLIQGIARAIEMHTIITTQRPSLDYIPKSLLDNSPCKIGFQLPYKKESELILGVGGAEKLLGQGDGIYVDGYNDENLFFQGFHVDIDDTKEVLDNILKYDDR